MSEPCFWNSIVKKVADIGRRPVALLVLTDTENQIKDKTALMNIIDPLFDLTKEVPVVMSGDGVSSALGSLGIPKDSVRAVVITPHVQNYQKCADQIKKYWDRDVPRNPPEDSWVAVDMRRCPHDEKHPQVIINIKDLSFE